MPQPPIPAGIIVADLCILTTHRMIRSRTYWSPDVAPETEIHLTVIADAVKTAFTTAIPDLMPTNHFFQRVECRFYGSGNSFFFANSVAAAGPGLIASAEAPTTEFDPTSTSEDIMPDDTALILQKKTGLRGRANQGRVFIGGMSEKVQFAGEVTELYIEKVKTLAGKLNTSITVNGSGYSSPIHGRHWNRKDNVMRPITKVYAVKAIGSRMDRRPKLLYERL